MQILILLERLRSFYESEAPFVLERPSEKATTEQIAQFEKDFEVTLPDDYKTFITNNDMKANFKGNYNCLSFAEVVASANMMKKLLEDKVFDDGRMDLMAGNWDGDFIQKVWWSTKWIPFAEDSCANMLCIDLNPEKNGTLGQIIKMEVQDAQGPFLSSYKSFEGVLAEYVEALEAGKYQIDGDSIGIVD